MDAVGACWRSVMVAGALPRSRLLPLGGEAERWAMGDVGAADAT